MAGRKAGEGEVGLAAGDRARPVRFLAIGEDAALLVASAEEHLLVRLALLGRMGAGAVACDVVAAADAEVLFLVAEVAILDLVRLAARPRGGPERKDAVHQGLACLVAEALEELLAVEAAVRIARAGGACDSGAGRAHHLLEVLVDRSGRWGRHPHLRLRQHGAADAVELLQLCGSGHVADGRPRGGRGGSAATTLAHDERQGGTAAGKRQSRSQRADSKPRARLRLRDVGLGKGLLVEDEKVLGRHRCGT
eukprot:CAMPEP_0183419530 /NCGR_PEP_ID=MMETSP0370-20130417/25851_1 /TAXON_ID=268820 /ORGANISM="Peridinium aciculiferum, Strain PAER-2" /LENGTH=250 /DNA_ID=CAMNT_0025603337 /DNA_START=119 /DNA_END=867 /DNA_ORIENTATION=-